MIHVPRCIMCANLITSENEFKCEAFPDGIPEDKLYADYDEDCNGDFHYEEE